MVEAIKRVLRENVSSNGDVVQNYHTRLLRVQTESHRQYVAKTYRPKFFEGMRDLDLARQKAEEIRDDVLEYHRRLKTLDIPVSPTFEVIVESQEQPFMVISISCEGGRDLRVLLRQNSKDLKLASHLIYMALVSLRAFLTGSSREIGLDSNPANFCFLDMGDNANFSLLFDDLFPPMYRKNGVCLAGYPHPDNPRLAESNYQRYYTPFGVLRIFRFNLMRIDPALEDIFFQELQNTLGDKAKQFGLNFQDLHEREIAVLLRENRRDKICSILREKDQYKIDDLREMAFRILLRYGKLSLIDELFKLTMQDFLIPIKERERRLQKFKDELIALIP